MCKAMQSFELSGDLFQELFQLQVTTLDDIKKFISHSLGIQDDNTESFALVIPFQQCVFTRVCGFSFISGTYTNAIQVRDMRGMEVPSSVLALGNDPGLCTMKIQN